MNQEIIAYVAAIMALIGNIPYLIKVIKHEIQPHAYTWLIWSIISCVVFFGALIKGAGYGAIPTGVAEIFTIFIFLFALRNGFKDITFNDNVFLAFALLGLIPWWLTNDPTISVIIVVSIDLIAFIPTIRKTWENPKSEASLLFAMNVVRHILTLMAVGVINIATSMHSIAMIITNTIMVCIILRIIKKGNLKKTRN